MAGRVAAGKGQIALEFIIIYSLVLVIFIVVFGLVTSQRAASLAQQQNSFLQLISQNVASAIQQAVSSGNGYATTLQLPASISSTPYSLYVTSTGLVLANMSISGQVLSASASSGVASMVVNGTELSSNDPIKVYSVPVQSGSVSIANRYGTVYVNAMAPGFSGTLASLSINVSYVYSGVTSIAVNAISASGSRFPGSRMGLVALQGASSVQVTSGFTGPLGNLTLEVTPDNSYATQNAFLYSSVLNGSAANGLLSWLPLTYGFGNRSYDIGTVGSNGIITNDGNGLFGKPWAAMPKNVTNVQIASFNSVGRISVNLSSSPLNTSMKHYNTVSFWMYWKGSAPVIPVALGSAYSLEFSSASCFGFSSNNGDTYGINPGTLGLSDKWTLVTAVFYNGYYLGNSTLYINGAQQSLSQCSGISRNGTASKSLYLSGSSSGAYLFDGYMTNVQLYNARLSQAQVSWIYGQGIFGSPILMASLIGWWPLHGDARDYGTYGADGAASSLSFLNQVYYANSTVKALNLSSGQFGSYGTKVDYGKLGINANTLQGVNFSVNQWFMLGSAQTGTNLVANSNPIADIYNGSKSNGAGLGIGGGQNFDLAGSWAGGAMQRFSWAQYSPSMQYCYTAQGTVQPGTWYDALVTVSSYSNVTIYLNGLEASRCTLSAVSASSLSAYAKNLMLAVGANPSLTGSGEFAKAYIADIELYNTTLSAQQAQQLYTMGVPAPKTLTMAG